MRKNINRFVCALMAVVLLLGMMPGIHVLAAKEQFYVRAFAVTGIEEPLEGNKPDFVPEISSSAKYEVVDKNTSGYIHGVLWSEYDADWEWQRDLDASSTFKAGYYYVVHVVLKTENGKYFTSSVTGTIQGVNANIVGRTSDNTQLTAYVTFGPSKGAIRKVDLTVVMPKVGKTPTFAKVNTTTYESKNNDPKLSNQSNGVVWTNMSTSVNLTVSNPFKENTKYSVTYTLYPKRGYVFTTNVTATINGKAAQVRHFGDYIEVKLTDLVPASNKKPISSVTLNVTAPAAGQKPVFNKIDAEGFYSDNNANPAVIYKNGIAWYKTAYSYIAPGTTETFEAGKDYTLRISLTAKDGYEFADNVTAKVNGKTATVTAYDDSITVEVVFSVPKAQHTHKESAWKTDSDNHWKVCTDTECGAMLVQKQKHADTNKDGKCDTCGYNMPVTKPTTTAPTTTKPEPKPTEPKPTEPKPTETKPTEPVNTTEPEVTEPEVTEPEATEPSVTEPEATEPGTTEPEKPTQPQPTEPSQTEKPENNLSWIWILVAIIVAAGIGAGVALLVKKKK